MRTAKGADDGELSSGPQRESRSRAPDRQFRLDEMCTAPRTEGATSLDALDRLRDLFRGQLAPKRHLQ
jgi:hypothetical protein